MYVTKIYVRYVMPLRPVCYVLCKKEYSLIIKIVLEWQEEYVLSYKDKRLCKVEEALRAL